SAGIAQVFSHGVAEQKCSLFTAIHHIFFLCFSAGQASHTSREFFHGGKSGIGKTIIEYQHFLRRESRGQNREDTLLIKTEMCLFYTALLSGVCPRKRFGRQ